MRFKFTKSMRIKAFRLKHVAKILSDSTCFRDFDRKTTESYLFRPVHFYRHYLPLTFNLDRKSHL